MSKDKPEGPKYFGSKQTADFTYYKKLLDQGLTRQQIIELAMRLLEISDQEIDHDQKPDLG